ncbi:hypothetical protein AMECASPLE_006912 [Ameca splendens]|uniref:E3 ubiquitin-protein ligase RBBP6 n=1 Tax=Ameca splendens TaxID=208324 RepID=A0ABV1A5U3_9TELE
MAHIHYKFSSKLSYDTVVFDGPNISLTDLKKQIMAREKLRAGDCDLQITNAQTKEEFTEDGVHIPKGSSVIVRRIPIIGKSSSHSKTNHKERSDVQIPNAFGSHRKISDSSSTRALSFFSKMQLANLAEADVSEEDKIRVMMNQSSCEMMKNSKLGPVLPENYACYRCGNTGHHIRNCPVSLDKNVEAPPRIKKSTGIPRSFMVEVDDPNIKGVMLTSCGRYAIPAIDAEAYAVGKKEKPPFILQEQPKCEEKEEPIPDELLCLICRDLLSDAVVIPCCGNSYCDDCIRTTLLESEDHLCPTCGQSDVSPDTLIANKFLRQAVNNFKKDLGCGKGQRTMSVTTQSQNTAPKPSPVLTLTPPTIQNKIKKPLQSPCTEQESLVNKPKPEPSPSLPQSTDGPPATPEPAPVGNSSENTSPQPEQSHAVTPNKEELEKTHDNLETVAPSDLVSDRDSPDAPSQLISQVNSMEGTEQLQTACVNQRQSSSYSTTRLSRSSTSRDSICSTSTYPAGSLTESSLEQPKTSSSSSSCSSLPATPLPLFPSPPFHTFVHTHQPLSSCLPGYPPTTPTWKLPIPPGAPIPSLCSSSSTSSIPVLIPKEWYRFQRKKKERSPHKRSISHSVSKSSKSKSSRSYSGSSSRSGSRSRARSRHRSPYANHRDFHSHSNHSRSCGYKRPRSPTPSSSSSPLSGSISRSKMSSDRSRKNCHHRKRSALSSHSSKRRGERSSREARKSSRSKHLNDISGLKLERQWYLQWKKEYQEWYNKYFSSCISHFHQLPFPPPPPPPPNTQDSIYLKQGGETVRKDDGCPTSEDSTYSRSSSSHSSNDRRPPICHPSSDSCSSPQSNGSQSSPSHSSNDGPSAPSEAQLQLKDNLEKGTEKVSSLPDFLTKSSEEINLQEMITDDNPQIKKKVDDCSPLKHKQKKKPEKFVSSDSSGSINVLRQDKRRRNTEPNSCKDGSPVGHEETPSDSLKLVQALLKPNRRLDKGKKEKPKEEIVEREQGSRIGKGSHSCQNRERKHKTKPSADSDRLGTEVHQHPEGSKTPDSKSERDKKRKKQDKEINNKPSDIPSKTKSSKYLQPKTAEQPNSLKRESLMPSDRRTQRTEKKGNKASPLTEKDIWEGGIKVISQKKISININLDGKRKDEKTEQNSSSSGVSTQERKEPSSDTEEEFKKENTETVVNKNKESSPGLLPQEKPSILQEIKESRNKATSNVDQEDVCMKIPREEQKDGEKNKKGEEDLDLWHCALKGLEDKKERTRGKEEEADRGKDGCRDQKMVLTQIEKGRENRGEAQKEDKAVRSSSQRSKPKNLHDRHDDASKHSRGDTEGSQEMTAGEKLLEDVSKGRAKVSQNEHTQVIYWGC